MNKFFRGKPESISSGMDSFSMLNTNRLNIIGCGLYFLLLLITEIYGIYLPDSTIAVSPDFIYWLSAVLSIVFGSAFIKFHVKFDDPELKYFRC